MSIEGHELGHIKYYHSSIVTLKYYS